MNIEQSRKKRKFAVKNKGCSCDQFSELGAHSSLWHMHLSISVFKCYAHSSSLKMQGGGRCLASLGSSENQGLEMMPSHDPDIVTFLFYEQGDRLGETIC